MPRDNDSCHLPRPACARRLLHAHVHDPEPPVVWISPLFASRGGERGLTQGALHRALAQASHIVRDADHDAQRFAPTELWSRLCAASLPTAFRLAPGTGALAATRLEELLLDVAFARSRHDIPSHDGLTMISPIWRRFP